MDLVDPALLEQEALERLALVAEYREDPTHEHALRVGRTAALIAGALDLPEEEVDLIRRAAPLHDLGKIAVPDELLLAPRSLEARELMQVYAHAEEGARILGGSRNPVLRRAEQIARSHHEHWDGSGYPEGLAGEDIPLAARIVAVADAFDVLAAKRPRRELLPVDEAAEEIRREAGGQFDPAVVQAFLTLDHDVLLAPIDRAESRTDEPARRAGGRRFHRPMLSLQEAADGLGVSASTLRRWADAGRIRAVRTPGGHRRFHAEDLRALKAALGETSRPAVRPVSPPTHALPTVADGLRTDGRAIVGAALRALYRSESTGWFAGPDAEAPLRRWVATLAAAARTAEYGEAVVATRVLIRHATIGGATLLECHTFLGYMRAAVMRLLAARGADPQEAAGAHRLMACFEQRLLDEHGAAQRPLVY